MAAICSERSDHVISEATLDWDIEFLSLHNDPLGGSVGLSGYWSLSPPCSTLSTGLSFSVLYPVSSLIIIQACSESLRYSDCYALSPTVKKKQKETVCV